MTAMFDTSTIIAIWGVLTGGFSVISGLRTNKSLASLRKEHANSASSLTDLATLISDRLSVLENRLVLSSAIETKRYDIGPKDLNALSRKSDSIASVARDSLNSSKLIVAPAKLSNYITNDPEKAMKTKFSWRV